MQTLQSYWFIKSESLGKVGVGLQSMVPDNLAILVDGSGSLVPANWVSFDVGGFQYRNAAGGSISITRRSTLVRLQRRWRLLRRSCQLGSLRLSDVRRLLVLDRWGRG